MHMSIQGSSSANTIISAFMILMKSSDLLDLRHCLVYARVIGLETIEIDRSLALEVGCWKSANGAPREVRENDAQFTNTCSLVDIEQVLKQSLDHLTSVNTISSYAPRVYTIVLTHPSLHVC